MIEKIREIANKTAMSEAEVAGTLHSQAENGLPLNLQFFAEDSTDEDNQTDDKQDNDEHDDNQDKTFTQSELDSQVSKAVETALKNRDKEVEKRIEKERQEAERLAKLTEKEREKEQLTIREQELDKRAKELERKELLSDAESTLRDKELPVTFAGVLLGEDADTTLDNINNFKKTFDEAVNNAVKERLRQDTPPAGSGKVSNKQPSVADLAKENRIIN